MRVLFLPAIGRPAVMRTLAHVRAVWVLVCLAIVGAPSAAASAQDEGPDSFRVSVLGDSVAAGFGLKQNPLQIYRCSKHLPTNDCDTPELSFSAIAARGLTSDERDGLPLQYVNRAIAGARPGPFLGSGQLAGRVRATVKDDPDIVVLMVGANDLLSAKKTCIVRPGCARDRLKQERTAETVHELLNHLLDETSASIFVMRYYRLDTDLGNSVGVLNDALEDATRDLRDDLTVVTPPSFRRHGCAAPPFVRWVLYLVKDFCLHPNKRGHKHLAKPLLEAFQDEFATDDFGNDDFGDDFRVAAFSHSASSGRFKSCRAVAFEPRTEWGASSIRVRKTSCRTGRRLARRSKDYSVITGPWRYRARGFVCRGKPLDTALPTARWRCERRSAVVKFIRG